MRKIYNKPELEINRFDCGDITNDENGLVTVSAVGYNNSKIRTLKGVDWNEIN
jgi:hypothetical protein